MSTRGMTMIPNANNVSLDPLGLLADAIADRVVAKLQAKEGAALLSVADAAKYLGRGQGAVRGMIAKRILPVVRMGGRVMIRREDADRVIESSTSRG
jgi:excisionase family DNA binding protein